GRSVAVTVLRTRPGVEQHRWEWAIAQGKAQGAGESNVSVLHLELFSAEMGSCRWALLHLLEAHITFSDHLNCLDRHFQTDKLISISQQAHLNTACQRYHILLQTEGLSRKLVGRWTSAFH